MSEQNFDDLMDEQDGLTGFKRIGLRWLELCRAN
jgi:hypothetical protein